MPTHETNGALTGQSLQLRLFTVVALFVPVAVIFAAGVWITGSDRLVLDMGRIQGDYSTGTPHEGSNNGMSRRVESDASPTTTKWQADGRADSVLHCDQGDPLRVRREWNTFDRHPRDRRLYCHGAALLTGRRECAWPLGSHPTSIFISTGQNNPFGAYIRTSAFDRDFEVRPRAILSSEGRLLMESAENSVARAQNIAIVTQGTMDRILQHLDHMARIWQGPISIAVFVDDPQRDEALVVKLISETPLLQQWVDVHFVRRRGYKATDAGTHYPINMLRNVAMEHAVPDWNFVLDLDVFPSACMSAFVSQVAAAEQMYASAYEPDGDTACPGLVAYIPPSVELPQTNGSLSLHNNTNCIFHSKADAVADLQTGRLRPMHMYFPPAYMPTNHSRWMSTPSKDGFFEVQYELHFEPYFIARKDIPRFNESFVDRGGNFAQQVLHMNGAGFRFVVLSDVFTIDQPHGPAGHVPLLPERHKFLVQFEAQVVRAYGLTPPPDLAGLRLDSSVVQRLMLEVEKFSLVNETKGPN